VEENLNYYVKSIDGEFGHNYDFTIYCNNKRFVVTVCPGPLSNDQTTLLLERYSQAVLVDDHKETDVAQDEISDMIYEAGPQEFAHLAPKLENELPGSRIDLYSDLNPETFYLRLVMVEGTANTTQEYPTQSQYDAFCWTINDTQNLPKHSAREIIFTERFLGTGYIAKVSVNGRDMCCKVVTNFHGKAIQREYECLQKIAMSKHVASIKAPKLVGFIVDDNEEVIGILEEFIPHADTLGRVEGVI